MPLPEACEQEAATVTAARELSTRPGMDMVSAGPRKPRKFSKLVLLTASKDSAKVAGAKRRGVHCIMSLGVPGSATLAKALLKTHPETQRALEAPPEEPEQKRCKPALDADAKEAVQLSLDPPVGDGEGAAPHPPAPARDLDPAPEQAGGRALLSA
ncbi:FLYWCH family member 2 [Ochotona princeps]|uniref:FLYWCH family member 2 n=1 Tax=Ochotona princeps TaxID=9978 RepID=UPI002714F375|nr:FLYWCH family member 2 [Ochotona princeps]